MMQQMAKMSGEYYWGSYKGQRVVVMRSNGYINASRLCKDNGKQISNWLKTKKAKDAVAAFGDGAIISTTRGDHRGKYMHPGLIAHIMPWLFKPIAEDNTYKKVKRTPSLSMIMKAERGSKYTLPSKETRYTLKAIIRKVRPVYVLDDLTGTRRDIKQMLRSNVTKYCGIYMFYNKATNEYYIGSSKNIITRTMSYLAESYVTREARYNNLILEAMTKYGKESFALLILELIDDHTQVFEREKYYIHLLMPKYNVDLYSKKREPSLLAKIIDGMRKLFI
jgi:hypothetical protein